MREQLNQKISSIHQESIIFIPHGYKSILNTFQSSFGDDAELTATSFRVSVESGTTEIYNVVSSEIVTGTDDAAISSVNTVALGVTTVATG